MQSKPYVREKNIAPNLYREDSTISMQYFEQICDVSVQNTVTDMMLLVSDNSSTISSQDEQDLKVQEKILSHLIEPQKLFRVSTSEEKDKAESKPNHNKNVNVQSKGAAGADFEQKQTNYRLDSLNRAFEMEDVQIGVVFDTEEMASISSKKPK